MGWLECIFPGRQLIRVDSGHDKSPVPSVSGLDLTPHFTPSIPGQFYLSAGGLLDSQIVSLEVVGPSYQDFPQHLICWGFCLNFILAAISLDTRSSFLFLSPYTRWGGCCTTFSLSLITLSTEPLFRHIYFIMGSWYQLSLFPACYLTIILYKDTCWIWCFKHHVTPVLWSPCVITFKLR